MVLIVFLSSRISPRTSTVIFFERSPFATAVVTSAMLRTCEVRFEAMKFTDSVRSFHVPETPATSACPPSLPSEPTSRATRVTSPANELSWSTMMLIVFFSSKISPRASTVILRERSPFATAVVTLAMLRTWLVKLPAIVFTESVRSFQLPATPLTLAWPPSLPSEPTSRATRVTSDAKALSWSAIVLMTRADRKKSPRSGRPSMSKALRCERSPCATAAITRFVSAIGAATDSMSELYASICSCHPPLTPSTAARLESRPSRAMTRLTRLTSLSKRVFVSRQSLNAAASSASIPSPFTGRRTEKSPLRNACSAASILRWCAVATSEIGSFTER